MSLMQTKLYPPRSRSDMISRARLIERLNDGLHGNVTLVCAPAGFGKTTLLTQWLQTIDRHAAVTLAKALGFLASDQASMAQWR